MGATHQYVAVGRDAAGNVVQFSPTWSVVQGGGTISSTGLFTAGTMAGTYANTVQATDGTVSASATAVVTAGPMTNIAITPDPLTLNVGLSNQFAAIAYERQTQHGLFGVGLAHTAVADSFQQRNLADVWDAEVFFRVSFANDRVQLTPSIQHVENPGFGGTGSGTLSTATVASIRLHASF